MKLHHKPLQAYRDELYANLLYSHHATTNRVLKYRQFYLPEEGLEKKDWRKEAAECDLYSIPSDENTKVYALSKEMIKALPIKIKVEEVWYSEKDDAQVHLIREYSSFRKRAEKKLELRDVIKGFLSPHSLPAEYELYVVIAFALLIGKGACWFSTNRAFGKSSIFKTMNYVFDNVVVRERPRTVPSFYKHIPEDGIMIFDEMSKKDRDSAENMADVLNLLGDVNESEVHMKTGGSSAYGTNVVKKTGNCSSVCLMNLKEDYDDSESFAEYMFDNNEAPDRRFIKFRTSKGEIDFQYFDDWQPYTPEEKELLKDYVRTIEWYKQNFLSECNSVLVDAGLLYLKDKSKQTHRATVKLFLQVMSIYWKDEPGKYQEGLYILASWIKNYSNALIDQPSEEPQQAKPMSATDSTPSKKQTVSENPTHVSFNKTQNKLMDTIGDII